MAAGRRIGYRGGSTAMTAARPRILLVEDDPRTSASIALYLRHAGYETVQVADGLSALETASAMRPDLVVLDLMLPGLDGFEVCRTLRAASGVPVIMLTARALEEDKLRGLDSGADDYVTKPFSPRELVARVGAVLRRVRPAQTVLRCGDVEIDLGMRAVRRNGAPVPLTVTEFRLLEALASTPGRPFSRAELAERALAHDTDALDRTIDVHVMNLRRKLDPDRTRGRSIVATVFGIGYRLETADDGR
jgi:DNA-binding response OmpR family regulator